MIVTDNLPTWAEIRKKLGNTYGPPIADRLERMSTTLVVGSPLSKTRKKRNGNKKAAAK